MDSTSKHQHSRTVDQSRRKFLQTSMTAAAAFTIVPRHILGGVGYQAASDMVNVAGIGVGARGSSDIQGFADIEAPFQREFRGQTRTVEVPESPKKFANIYALCDVDTEKAGFMFQAYPRAKRYTDWREMLEKEPNIDAVMIATPDHNHAPIAAAAMKAGKHVYVEKPMCKTVYETRELRRIAKETGVVTQMGNQGHNQEGTYRILEWVKAGVLGDVREVRLATNRPIWPQGNMERPEGMPVPATLNWDIWIGPAPMKPYNPEVCHFNWRGLWDYGTGAIGDMGAHIYDASVRALDLPLPSKVQSSSTPYSDAYLPQAETIYYEFPARGNMPPVKVSWVDGGLTQERPDALPDGLRPSSAVLIGSNGRVLVHGDYGRSPRVYPESAMEEVSQIEPTLERPAEIHEDFINAIKNGTKANSDFEVAGHLTEIMLVGLIATQAKNLNTTLEYDGKNMTFTNQPKADQYFHYEYRDGWTL